MKSDPLACGVPKSQSELNIDNSRYSAEYLQKSLKDIGEFNSCSSWRVPIPSSILSSFSFWDTGRKSDLFGL